MNTASPAICRKPRTWASFHTARDFDRTILTYSTSGMHEPSMNTMAIQWMALSSKKPKDLSWVEKPAVDTVVMAWLSASNAVMPAR